MTNTTITPDLLRTLAVAQMRFARDWNDLPTSDDDFDYAAAAYELAATMLRLAYDDDTVTFLKMCTDSTHVDFIADNYASGGVCDEIAALVDYDL
jgi:hypothetical protein